MFNALRLGLTACWITASLALAQAPAALPSWTDGKAKNEIVGFIDAVTRQGPDFVPPADRVAVFDNDGTLWVEQPIYTEVAFSLQRAAALAKANPALAAKPAFQAVLSGDPARVAALPEKDLLELVAATHSGLTTEAFTEASRAWLAAARHPKFNRPYTGVVYQPMLELMDYLRAHGFSVYIVSGGDADFMRTFSASTYGVDADQVIGSSNKTEFKQVNGRYVLERTPVFLLDDKQDKPSNIGLHIGRRPIFAAGNSDGDLQMLQYATSGGGRRMGLIVRHDDAAREYAYDRQSKVGTLDKALDAAGAAGWTVVSMKSDWRAIFPTAPKEAP